MNQISGSSDGHITIEVPAAALGNRLDHFLVSALGDLSRNRIAHLIDEGCVSFVGGAEVKSSLKLKGGELLEISIPEPETIEALPEEIPLNILYEDSSVIVIDKAAGMVVHPAPGHSSGTLVNALLFHCKDLSGVGGMLRPGIVHRLDKDTSGVMMATKNDHAHKELAAQFKLHTVKRRYKAIVYGEMAAKGKVDLPLGRHPVDRQKIAVVKNGKNAVTHWRVLETFQGISFVELRLETGRTHQIRVHLAKSGHPVIGDQKYASVKRSVEIKSGDVRDKIISLKRQALHASVLGFKHPDTGEYMEFSSELPEDIKEILMSLRERP
ncbi:MAG: RluA family pseudouridine synthase [bacterium]|nr:RluA family pseudouridine synthase [bacterium]